MSDLLRRLGIKFREALSDYLTKSIHNPDTVKHAHGLLIRDPSIPLSVQKRKLEGYLVSPTMPRQPTIASDTVNPVPLSTESQPHQPLSQTLPSHRR